MIPIEKKFVGTRGYRFLDKFGTVLVMPFFYLLRAIGVIRYNSLIRKAPSSRGAVLWEEAQRRGIPMRSFVVFGRYLDAYEAVVTHEGKKKTLRFIGLPRPDPKKNGGFTWMDDKGGLKTHLQRANLPVAPGGVFSNWNSLRNAFDTLAKPVMIKPRLGSRGRHTTTFIYTEDELREAFRVAKQLCHWVVMEEHLYGDVYRGTMIDGKLVGVLGGDPPRITGDGTSTIKALIARKNDAKREGVRDFVPSSMTITFLARNKYTLETVLPRGLTIDLTEKIGVNYGGSSFEVTEETHPEIKRILEAAAKVVDDPLFGFDFIIDNVKDSPEGKKWGIIEANSLPFINLHHDPLIGKPQNVAKYVWDLWER